jgi:hypothetical protein
MKSYPTMRDHLQRNEIDSSDLDEGMMRFKAITSHEGPLTTKHLYYKGSRYNLQVEWDNGDVTLLATSSVTKKKHYIMVQRNTLRK